MVQVALGVIVLSCVLASPVLAQDAKAGGEKVYSEQKCSICHSLAGKGNAKGPLDDIGSRLSSDEIHAWIADATVDVRDALTAHLAAGGVYWYDSYRVNDFALGAETIRSLTQPSSLMLGYLSRPYTANTIMIMARLTDSW